MLSLIFIYISRYVMASMIFFCFISKTGDDDDVVTIYDGYNSASHVIQKLSGNLERFGISSSGNTMFIMLDAKSLHWMSIGFLAKFHYGKTGVTLGRDRVPGALPKVLLRIYHIRNSNLRNFENSYKLCLTIFRILMWYLWCG